MSFPSLTFQGFRTSPSFLDGGGVGEEAKGLGACINPAETWEEVADLRDLINKVLLKEGYLNSTLIHIVFPKLFCHHTIVSFPQVDSVFAEQLSTGKRGH